MDPTSRIGSLATRSLHEVAAERTAVSPAQLRIAIGRAYQRVTGQSATPSLLDTLTAQASLETGHGAKMYNFNFGGIKGASPRGETANYSTHEVVGGKTLTLKQGFRAYTSLDEGAEDYVRVLSGRFGGALSRAQVGDVDGFSHALKQAGYYTAPEAEYSAALRGLTGAHDTTKDTLGIVPTADAIGANAGYSTSEDVSRMLDALSGSALRIIASRSDDE